MIWPSRKRGGPEGLDLITPADKMHEAGSGPNTLFLDPLKFPVDCSKVTQLQDPMTCVHEIKVHWLQSSGSASRDMRRFRWCQSLVKDSY